MYIYRVSYAGKDKLWTYYMYRSRLAAYAGIKPSAIRNDNEGKPDYCLDVQKEDGKLTHAWLQQSAQVKYTTFFFPKDPAKGNSHDLVLTAQMPQKVGDDAGASNSS